MSLIGQFLFGVAQSLTATLVAVLVAWLLVRWAVGWWARRYRTRAGRVAAGWDDQLNPELILRQADTIDNLISGKGAEKVLPLSEIANWTGVTVVAGKTGSDRSAIAVWVFRDALERGAAAPMLIDVSKLRNAKHMSDLISDAEPGLWSSRLLRILVPRMLSPQLVGFLMERLWGDLKIVVNDAHLLEARAMDELVNYARAQSARLLLLVDLGSEATAIRDNLTGALGSDAPVTCYLLASREGGSNVVPSTAEECVALLVKWGRLVAGGDGGEGSVLWRNRPAGCDRRPLALIVNKGSTVKYKPLDSKAVNAQTSLLGVTKVFYKKAMKGRSELTMWHCCNSCTNDEPVPNEAEDPTLLQLWRLGPRRQ